MSWNWKKYINVCNLAIYTDFFRKYIFKTQNTPFSYVKFNLVFYKNWYIKYNERQHQNKTQKIQN